MLKFHQIVLRKFLALFLLLFLIVGGIVYFWEYEYYLDSSRKALLDDIKLLSLQISKDSDLDKLASDLKNTLHLRLTIIDNSGKVLAESHKDKTTMENHRYRPEIMQARKEAYGYIKRHSKTVDKDLQYVVKKYTINGQIIYIRLAKELSGIQEQIILLGLKIFFALVFFFLAIFYITYRINADVQYEVKKIISFLRSMVRKQKSTFIQSDYSEEFALITKLLTKVSQIMVKQDKKRSKHTSKLEKLNRQKDDIISAISHEFKNPIAVVNGYSQTLIDDQDINSNIRTKFLQKINANGTKLSELIDTLRLSLKIDSHQQSLNLVTCNVHELVSDATENLMLNYPRRSIIIQGQEDITIEADKTMFGVVVVNLIENALKYSEDDVKVIFDKQKLSVIDNGVGISQKNLEKITEKFYRVSKNSWNNSLGLGLFLVNNIIKLHHFKLDIKSEPNEGSTFTILFS